MQKLAYLREHLSFDQSGIVLESDDKDGKNLYLKKSWFLAIDKLEKFLMKKMFYTKINHLKFLREIKQIII